MDELIIRPATAADLDEVHALEREAFPEPWKREFFEGELSASGRLNIVVRHGYALAGYVFAMWFFDEMHINKIAVAKQLRRQGVATRLMDHCFRFAREHQIGSISLEVRASNQSARDFYRHLEFVDVYVRPRYYPDGESALVMTRSV